MALELKVESLRARGELTAEERDRLLALLKTPPEQPAKKRRLLTPLRIFLVGVACGIAVAYLAWGFWF